MTREEAITYIHEWLKDEYALNHKDKEVLNMAIKALEQPIYIAKAKAGDVEELLKIIDKGGAIISPNHTTSIVPIYAEVLDKIRVELLAISEYDYIPTRNAMEIIDKYKESEG